MPVIYVTHNMSEVLALADWVLVISKGRIVTQGIPQQVLRSSKAMTQIAEEQLENVFSVTFVTSDREAGRTKVRLPFGQHLFYSLYARTSKARFADRHQGR